MDNNQMTAKIRAQITTINIRYRQLTSSLRYMTTAPPKQEVDPDYVHVAFSVPDLGEAHDCSGSVTLKKEEVRRLDLMVGDVITITVLKEEK